MLTVCPKCSLKLVVTPADLRVAQGFVRCGRCSNVFNALNALMDEEQAATAQQPAPPQQPAPAPQRAPAQQHQTTPPATAKQAASAPAARQAVSPPPPPPPPPAAPKKPEPQRPEDLDISLEFDATSTHITPIKIPPPKPPEPAKPAEPKPAEQKKPSQPIYYSDDTVLDDIAVNDVPVDVTEVTVISAQRLQAEQPETTELEAEDDTPVAPPPPPEPEPPAQPVRANRSVRRASRDDAEAPVNATSSRSVAMQQDVFTQLPLSRSNKLWNAAAIALLLLLGMQIVHHYRAELAAQPRLNGLLTSLYGAFGVELTPEWDLSAYEVRQLGAVAGRDNPGQLAVRFSLKNSAERAQPMPILRVTVQDRYGNPVAARDVTPDVYVANPAQQEFIGAGQRIDAEIRFLDPGQIAVGFEIDACLSEAQSGIICANDLSTR